MADLSTSGGQVPDLGIARPAGAGTFVRQATGLVRQATRLVRQASMLDTLVDNANNQNIGIGMALSPPCRPDVDRGGATTRGVARSHP
jgi:hypothetical protein